MDSRVAARFFRASGKLQDHPDFPDLLLTSAQPTKVADRERTIGDGVLVRLERCAVEGEFLAGEFCRKQVTGIPPEAGPDGLLPIKLDGGLGHMAAFRYHKPTRVLLLQTNRLSVNPGRITHYISAINSDYFYAFKPVLRQDAWERMKDKKVRRVTVGFAAAANLDAFDDQDIAVAKGAAMLAKAYGGIEVEITVSVGRKRKKTLLTDKISDMIGKILGSGAKLKTLTAKTNALDDEEPLNFLEEHLKVEKEVSYLENDPDKHYQVRHAFLKSSFDDNLAGIKNIYEKKD